MRTTIITNCRKYPYHKEILSLFLNEASKYGISRAFDMADKSISLLEIYHQIEDSNCDLLISFDCAGFEFRTEINSLAYNTLSCRMAHILFQKMQEYGNCLKQQMNFSMFLFSMFDSDVSAIQEKYPNIPNSELISPLEYGSNTAQNNLHNKKIINKWFSHIIYLAELDG